MLKEMFKQVLEQLGDWFAHKWVYERADLFICTLVWIIVSPAVAMAIFIAYVGLWELMWYVIS